MFWLPEHTERHRLAGVKVDAKESGNWILHGHLVLLAAQGFLVLAFYEPVKML